MNMESFRHTSGQTKLVFPLYNEEVHLLARSDVRDFDDLANRAVAIGPREAASISRHACCLSSPAWSRATWSPPAVEAWPF